MGGWAKLVMWDVLIVGLVAVVTFAGPPVYQHAAYLRGLQFSAPIPDGMVLFACLIAVPGLATALLNVRAILKWRTQPRSSAIVRMVAAVVVVILPAQIWVLNNPSASYRRPSFVRGFLKTVQGNADTGELRDWADQLLSQKDAEAEGGAPASGEWPEHVKGIWPFIANQPYVLVEEII